MLALLLGACANFTTSSNDPRGKLTKNMDEPTPSLRFFYCDVCEMQSSSEVQHRDHLLGKRHWTNHRWKEEALKSIYVRGFDSDTTTKEDIRNVFSSFGVIHKIFLDSKGVYAIVEFSCIESALKVLRHPSPIHLKEAVLKLRQREYKPKISKKQFSKDEEGMEEVHDEEGTFSNIESTATTRNVKLPLNDEQIDSVLSRHSIDEQVSSFMSFLRLPPTSLHPHSDLLCRLKSYFSTVFSSCQVVPFGSMVTGLATPSSDMDVALLTNCTREDEECLGSCLLPLSTQNDPQTSHESIEDMETSGSEYPQTTPPPLAESLTMFSLPDNVKCAGGRNFKDWSNEYKGMLRVVSNVKEFQKIVAIPSARCPIVRFTDSVSGISCDVSVNNRLGLHNSKLLKSYLEFEPRLVPMMFVLRAWLKSCMPQVNLSNYALILMVIHCLQRATPPLLPCLQQQGPWPRNMAWFGTVGFTGEVAKDLISSYVDGWKLSLINHQSLLPSPDKRTLGELLHHFFHYYSSVFPFPTHAITIHSSPSAIMPKQDATEVATQCAPPNLPYKHKSFKVSCLTIQDPLELTHNVAKNISPKSLDILKRSMSTARDTMESLLHSDESSDKSILSIFGNYAPLQSSSTDGKTSRVIDFNQENISNVFRKVPAVNELVGLEIGLISRYVKERLGAVVLKTLVSVLETELGFTCVPVTGDDTLPVPASSQVYVPRSLSSSLTEPVRPVNLVKRQRNDREPDIMCDEGESDNAGIGEKRVRLDHQYGGTSITALLESHSQSPTGHGFYPRLVNCSTSINTWTHRRRIKRQEGGVSQATPLDPPILQFTMSCVPVNAVPDHSLVSIELSVHQNEDFVTEFQTFFAYFKKFVLH